jgi:signal transduction histidine kinase
VITRVRLREAILCAVAWIALGVVYGTLVYSQALNAMGFALSLRVGLENTAAPVLMGLIIWKVSAKSRWPPARPFRFLAFHAAGATAFALITAATALITSWSGSAGGMPLRLLYRVVLPSQFAMGILLYGIVACGSYAVRGALKSRDLKVVAERAERLRAQADLSAIRAHINPHFLFNTLHSVSELLREEPARATEALERLSDLFHYTLRLDRDRVELVTLEEEWEFTESYLWLERLRLGTRLCVDAAIDDDAAECAVPPFTLQPLVENAVRHGLGPSPDGGTLVVRAHERDGFLVMEVRDDGVGAEPQAVLSSAGLGVRSIRQRLEGRHGAAATVRIARGESRGLSVTVTLPAESVA